MDSLIIGILALGLGMLVSPGIFALTIILLSQRDKPFKKVLFFLLGNLLTLGILILAGFFIGSALQANPDQSLHKGLDLIIGFIFVFFGLSTLKHKEGKLKHKGDRKHFFWFFVGFVVSITNFDAETLFLVSMREITHLSGNFLLELSLIVYISFMILLPILLPVFIYLIFPTASKKILSRFNRPVQKYGYLIMVVLFILFGVFFLLKGFGILS